MNGHLLLPYTSGLQDGAREGVSCRGHTETVNEEQHMGLEPWHMTSAKYKF